MGCDGSHGIDDPNQRKDISRKGTGKEYSLVWLLLFLLQEGDVLDVVGVGEHVHGLDFLDTAFLVEQGDVARLESQTGDTNIKDEMFDLKDITG